MINAETEDLVFELLKVFADFYTNMAPEDLVITQGSRFAKRQLTMGDCRRAAEIVYPERFGLVAKDV